jgi:hypothetical protein
MQPTQNLYAYDKHPIFLKCKKNRFINFIWHFVCRIQNEVKTEILSWYNQQ